MAENVTKEDYTKVKGVEKAAILLLSLSEEKAAKIFSLMDDEEIREISQVMSTLGKVNSSIVENLFVEFANVIPSTGSLVGSYESTQRLLGKVLEKERVDTIMEEIRGPAGRTLWDKLSNVNEEILAAYLKNEYPQTIAVILSKIRTEHAAKVMALLPENLAMEIITRILRMESVQKDILDDIERTLRVEFMSNLIRSSRRDAYEMVAEIFNYFDRATESKFMAALEERNQEIAEKVKSLMFTFEDLVRVDQTGVQAILRSIDKTKLGLALKGASDKIKELFFKNMSERAAKILKDDMAALGLVRVKDVDEAQAYIVALAKELSSRGEVTISNSKDEGEQLIG
ncbi:MAG: flagellar motor switch protein FliG [Proteobacteria bacterium]|nr:flagellar motor switch protein FliG [Pseudomonadota bacterium]